MKLFQILRRKKFTIWVERKLLMMQNKEKIKVEEEAMDPEEELFTLIWVEEVVVSKVSILRIFLQVLLVAVVEEEEEVEEVEDNRMKDFISVMKIWEEINKDNLKRDKK